MKITRRADVEQYFNMLGDNRQAVVVDYSGVDLLFRVEVTPHGGKTETAVGRNLQRIIGQGQHDENDVVGKVSGRFVLTFGRKNESSYGDFEVAFSRLFEPEGKSTSNRGGTRFGFRSRFFADNPNGSLGASVRGPTGNIYLQKGEEKEVPISQVTFELFEFNNDLKLETVETATVSVYCQPVSKKSSQIDDPSKDSDSDYCLLGNSTTWKAVWPAGSTVTPQQVSLMQRIVSLEPKGMYFNSLIQ